MTAKNSRLRLGLVLLSSSALTAMVAAASQPEANRWHINKSISASKNQQGISKAELTTIVSGNGRYRLQRSGNKTSRTRYSSSYIHLKNRGEFDPLDLVSQSKAKALSQQMSPEIAQLYVPSNVQGLQAHIVQFHTQALPSDQQLINKLGGTVATSFPPNALLVLLDPAQLNQLQKQKSVRAVTPYLPADKLQTSLQSRLSNQSGEKHIYSIMAVTAKQRTQLENSVFQLGGRVITNTAKMPNNDQIKYGATIDTGANAQTSRFSAELNAYQLKQLLNDANTLYIDELGDPDGEDVDDVREREGFNWLESVAGYTGQGVGFEVYDSGFNTSHTELANMPNPILVRSPAQTGSGSSDHGVKVSGILYAQGVDPKYRGLIPNVARPIVFSRQSGFPGTNQPDESTLRSHLGELVDPNGPYRAVVQTSSTDYSTTTSYTTWSAEYDEVIFDLDLIKTQSQSNTGNQNSRPAAWSKNTIGVGGIRTLSTLSRSDDKWQGASIGPAADDRVKPDLSGQYDAFDMIGSLSGSTYVSGNGTSYSTPATGGAFAILFQMWADGVFDGAPGKQGAPEFRDVFDSRPHATTAKALMINTAYQYSFSGGDSHNLSRVKQGWGFSDVKNLYQTAESNNWSFPILVNEGDVVLPGSSNAYTLTVDGTKPLKATMVYKDPRGNPAASIARINDLSLKVTSPSGTVYWGNNGLRAGNWSTPGGTSNTIDTVENVFIQAPEVGTWNIEVLGDDIVQDSHVQTSALDADYALVASGGTSAPPTNQPPTVNAGADGSVQIPTAVALNGTVQDDNFQGTNLTISWSQISGPGSTIFADSSSAATSATFNTAGTYQLRLTANDGEFSVTDDVNVTVAAPPQNQAPTANAGANQTIELPATASLVGSCSDDGLPVNSSVSASWSGPPGVTFSNVNNASTTATFGSAGNYSVTLTCDDSVLSTQDSLQVTVNAAQPNQAPTVNAGGNATAILGSSIALTATASDDGRPFGSTLAYSWSSLSGPGTATFTAPNSLSTNVSFSAVGQYQIEFSANDGDLSTADSLTVTVSDVPVELTNDSFETDLGGWANVSTGDSHDWTRDSSGTPSSNTGPNSGSNGSTYYMYLETSSSDANTAGNTAILQSGSIDGSNRSFGFDYHMFGSEIGTLALEVSENNGAWSQVWGLSGQQQTSNSAAYNHVDVDLTANAGSIRLRFKATAVGGYRGDIAIDNLVLSGLNTPPSNQAPTISAGSNQTITLPSSANLTGSCSDDGLPSTGSLNCTWSGPSGVTFANASSATTTASFASTGTYTLTLTGADGELTSNDTLVVIVNPAASNQAPTANAGTDIVTSLAAGANLQGACTDDSLPSGNQVTASWSGNSSVTFGNASAASTSASFASTGNYTLTLTCSDGVLSGTDSVSVTVNDTPPPATVLYQDSFEANLGNWSNDVTNDNYDWSQDSGGTPSSSTGPSTGAGGSSGYVYLETSNNSGAFVSGDTAYLLSPTITESGIQLSFAYHLYGTDIGTLSVDVLQDGAWTNDVWTLSGQQQTSGTVAYTTQNVDLSAYNVQQIRFRAVAAGGYRGDMALDDIEISGNATPPTPQAPTFNSDPVVKGNATVSQAYSASIAADATDANGDSINFSKVSGPSWLSVASNGDLSGTPSSSDLGVNSFVVNTSDGSLSNNGNLQVTVSDGSAVVTLSSSDFESDNGDWLNVTGDSYDWTRDSGGTPSNSTGPTQGAGGSSWYFYLETSSSNGAFIQGDSAYLESIDLTGSNRTLSFDYHMHGVEIGTLSVDVFANGSWNNDVYSLTGQQQSGQTDAYQNASVDLSAYSGTIKIRLRATAAGGWKGDTAIDNIVVTGAQ